MARREVDDRKPPADKMPVTNQHLWDLAAHDYENAVMGLRMLRTKSDAAPEELARRERDVRRRQAMCNVVDFLITNREDIERVIADRKAQAQ